MLESAVLKRTWLTLSAGASTLFRLSTGKAWQSSLGPKGVGRTKTGEVVIKAPRQVPTGFGKPDNQPLVGAGDLIGWTTVTITPEMIGCKIAVFTSGETKATTGGRASDDQLNWRDQITLAGGIAFIANSESAAEEYVKQWFPPRA